MTTLDVEASRAGMWELLGELSVFALPRSSDFMSVKWFFSVESDGEGGAKAFSCACALESERLR